MDGLSEAGTSGALALFAVGAVVAVGAIVWGLWPARRRPQRTARPDRMRRRAVGAVGVVLGVVLMVGAVPLAANLAAGDSPSGVPAPGGPGSPAASDAQPTRVVLTPTATPANSQSFSWLAGDASHANGAVQLRPAGGGALRIVEAESAGRVNGNQRPHLSATVTGLAPATAYEYRVGADGGWSDWHRFSTADPGDTDFQFVYYGDAQIGLDSTWPSVVRQAEATAPQAIGSVHAGDLIDAAADDTQWAAWFAGMAGSAASANVIAAPGNHEYIDDEHLASWKAHFAYPANDPAIGASGALARRAVGDSEVAEQYAAYFAHWADFAEETVYFTDYQGVRFITLNATQDPGFLTPDNLPPCSGDDCPAARVGELWTRFQAEWLDQVLATSPSKWNVVTFHQPVFSASAGRDEPILREYWVPVLERHDVDLVMMGHDHTYARGSVDADRTGAAASDGPVYIVSNSGAKHYPLASMQDDVWTGNGATPVLRGQGVTTYQVVDVSEDRLVYRSYLAEKSADATTDLPIGSVYDEFTVTKSDDGEKRVTERMPQPAPR